MAVSACGKKSVSLAHGVIVVSWHLTGPEPQQDDICEKTDKWLAFEQSIGFIVVVSVRDIAEQEIPMAVSACGKKSASLAHGVIEMVSWHLTGPEPQQDDACERIMRWVAFEQSIGFILVSTRVIVEQEIFMAVSAFGI